jgi:predicted AlkP superfamily phosphohydrolase/phosphomutase
MASIIAGLEGNLQRRRECVSMEALDRGGTVSYIGSVPRAPKAMSNAAAGRTLDGRPMPSAPNASGLGAAHAPDARRRLLLIGLDSASPEYLFGRCLPVMPNVARLVAEGVHGPLRTTDPPISLPAWAVLSTGVDPGTLGMYGFRHRENNSYDRTYGPASNKLPVPTLWQILSDRGRRVCAIGMPPMYPPVPLNGISVSDFLTPSGATDTTFPEELRAELEARYGPLIFDVTFRAAERTKLFQEIVTMTNRRFAIAEDLFLRERWDVFAIHEVGTDRLHHAYTKYFDRTHPDFVAGNPYEHVLLDYYRVLDQALGRLLALTDNDTIVGIVSDHGSMPMAGCFCINQWLAERGYLRLRGTLAAGTPLGRASVDWSRTTVWGAGGYYARLFINRKGREPEGIVTESELPELEGRLRSDLAALRFPDGRPFPSRVLVPKEIYRRVVGDPPDLMVYFDDLRWRSAGTLGHSSLFLRENDTGPDDAVHSMEGVYLLFDPRRPDGRSIGVMSILDVVPTLLAYFGEPLPDHLQGVARPAAMPGGATA